MANFYADENFPQPATDALRELGHDVLTTQEAGQADQSISDPDVLAFAHQRQRILITLNRKDFIKLHRDGASHSGIVVCTVDVDFNRLANRVNDALTETENMSQTLIRVNRPNA